MEALLQQLSNESVALPDSQIFLNQLTGAQIQ
jgi:hypothetical protein